MSQVNDVVHRFDRQLDTAINTSTVSITIVLFDFVQSRYIGFSSLIALML